MRPTTRTGWCAAIGAAVIAGVLVVLFLVTMLREVSLVDSVPGADTGLVTSPALDRARAQLSAVGSALLVLAGITAAVLLMRARRPPLGRRDQ